MLNNSTSLTGREEPVSLPPELPISIRLPSKRETVDAIKAMKDGNSLEKGLRNEQADFITIGQVLIRSMH